MLLNESLKRPEKLLLVVLLLIWRVLIGFLMTTSFVPDEYYQVVEPAYRTVFGKGIM